HSRNMVQTVMKLVVFSLAVGTVLAAPAKLDQFFGHQHDDRHFAQQQQQQQHFSSDSIGKQVQDVSFAGGDFTDIQEDIRDGPFWDGSYYFRYVTADGTV
ncbi:unnamed protein product, partial [Meganyctiphanes norvegica]